jgi:hypothetical protein
MKTAEIISTAKIVMDFQLFARESEMKLCKLFKIRYHSLFKKLI